MASFVIDVQVRGDEAEVTMPVGLYSLLLSARPQIIVLGFGGTARRREALEGFAEVREAAARAVEPEGVAAFISWDGWNLLASMPGPSARFFRMAAEGAADVLARLAELGVEPGEGSEEVRDLTERAGYVLRASKCGDPAAAGWERL